MVGELREGDFQFGRLIWGDPKDRHPQTSGLKVSVCLWWAVSPAQDTNRSPGEWRHFPKARAGLTHVVDLWLCQP